MKAGIAILNQNEDKFRNSYISLQLASDLFTIIVNL